MHSIFFKNATDTMDRKKQSIEKAPRKRRRETCIRGKKVREKMKKLAYGRR